jgi:cytochrome c5
MINFDYQTPTRLIFGKGVVAEKQETRRLSKPQKALAKIKGRAMSSAFFYARTSKPQIKNGPKVYSKICKYCHLHLIKRPKWRQLQHKITYTAIKHIQNICDKRK